MRPNEHAGLESYYGSILQNDLFPKLRTELREDPALAASVVQFDPQSIVVDANDASGHIYALRRGNAVIYMNSSPEQRAAIHPVSPGRLYGVIEALAGGRSMYVIKTLTSCEFEIVAPDNFFSRVIKDPAVCFRLAQILSRMNHQILFSMTSG